VNILIVEDEILSAKFIKHTLEKLDTYRVSITDNAISCIDLVKDENIDLIFMDINIKGSMDGLQLAHHITSKYNIKIIFITSYDDSETIKEASLSRPLGYLIKPIIKSDIEAIMMVASAHLFVEKFDKERAKFHMINGPLKYNKKSKVVTYGDKIIKLSKLETKALEVFLQKQNEVISTETLIYQIWGEPHSNSSLRELISRIRKKIPNLNLKSHSNIGYILLDESS